MVVQVHQMVYANKAIYVQSHNLYRIQVNIMLTEQLRQLLPLHSQAMINLNQDLVRRVISVHSVLHIQGHVVQAHTKIKLVRLPAFLVHNIDTVLKMQ